MSVFSQQYQDFEVIVTDDSETDEIEVDVSRWAEDVRFRYFKNSVRLGSPANWNFALSLARGKYIKFLHHDDWFSNELSLGRYVDALEFNPNVFFAFSATNACRDDGTFLFEHQPTVEQIAALQQNRFELIYANFVGAPSATIFRNVAGFRFDEALKWVVDIDAYVRLLGPNGLFVFIPEPIISVTAEGAHQITQQVVSDPVFRIAEHLYLYRKYKSQTTHFLSSYHNIVQLLAGADSSMLREILQHPLTGKAPMEVCLAMLTQRLRLLAVVIKRLLVRSNIL